MTKKFSLKEIQPPSEQEIIEIAKKWWETHIGINFNDWNEILLKNSFPIEKVKLPQSLLNDTIKFVDGNKKEREKITFDFLVNEYSKLINPVLEKNKWEKFFVKLISRSAKDSMYDDNNYGKPYALKTVEEMIHAFLSSIRIFEDMCLLSYLGDCDLIIRPYINFKPENEFRIFIKNKKIVGISQYYYDNCFNNVIQHSEQYEKIIRDIIVNIAIPNFNLESYVVDVVVDEDLSGAKILEANPWGLSDPCLFERYNNFDGGFKYVSKLDFD